MTDRVVGRRLIRGGPVGSTMDEIGRLAVAGFVHHHLGRLPEEGERLEAEGLRVEVLEVEGRRVRRLRLTRLADPVVGSSQPNGEGPGPGPTLVTEEEPEPTVGNAPP